MNTKTKDALIKFINDVEILAQGVVYMTGVDDCQKLLENADDLKTALEKDETII